MTFKVLILIGIALVGSSFSIPILPQTYRVGQKVNGLTYIGRSPSQGQGHHSLQDGKYNPGSFYFTSEVSVNWKQAGDLCVSVLGNNAGLVSLENQDEHRLVTELLAVGNGKPVSYWTAGYFSTSLGFNYIWPSGQIIDSSFPWGEGQPTDKSTASRVSVDLNNDTLAWTLSSSLYVEPRAFICEYIENSAEIPQPCFVTNDLIIMLDSSGSINAGDYDEAKKFFVKDLAVQWSAWNQTKLGFSIFSNVVERQFSIERRLSQGEIITKIENARHIASGTASHLALDEILKEFQNYPRELIPKNVVFLTDGQSNEPEKTKVSANRLRDFRGPKGEIIQTYSVGIGQGIVREELKTIVGGNERHVFTAANFNELKNLLKPMSLVICDESEE